MRTLVYYALDNHPVHKFFLRHSLASLRRHNRDVPVILFFYGIPPMDIQELAYLHRAEIIQMDAKSYEERFFLKWAALSKLCELEIAADRLIYLDADTCCFEDIENVPPIEPDTIHARNEMTNWLEPQYSNLRRALNAEDRPLLNGGVLIFGQKTVEALGEAWPKMESLRRYLQKDRDLLPVNSYHFIDEAILCLTLGQLPKIRIVEMKTDFSTSYYEWKNNITRTKSVVMHFWTALAPRALLEFYGPEALKDAPREVGDLLLQHFTETSKRAESHPLYREHQQSTHPL